MPLRVLTLRQVADADFVAVDRSFTMTRSLLTSCACACHDVKIMAHASIVIVSRFPPITVPPLFYFMRCTQLMQHRGE